MMPGQKKTFLQRFRESHSLRLHMTAILLATACSGVLASKLLLFVRVENFAIRYPIAALVSYLVFFACIKLWLVALAPTSRGNTSGFDVLDIPAGGSGSGSGNAPFSGGSGEFAGGGASGDFELKAVGVPLAADSMSDAAEDAGSGVGDVFGGSVGDVLGDDGGLGVIVAIAVLAVVVAAVLGASAYVIYEAPVILSEAAFQGLLAASLTRRTRAMAQGDWAGSVFKATWKPFSCMLAVVTVAGLLLHGYFPEATRLGDIFR